MLTLVLHPGWRHRPPPVRPADGRIDPDGYSGSKDFMQISLHSLAVAGTGLPPVRQRSGLSAKRQDATGAGSDVVYNTNGEAGRLVDNQVNGRAISVDLAQLRPPPERVLISGGKEKIRALRGAINVLRPTVLITDEITAKDLLL